MNNIEISVFKIQSIKPVLNAKNKRLKVNSYGKDMNKQPYGYSLINSKYLAEKWIMSNEPFDGSYEVADRLMKYWKLKVKEDINTKE